MDEVELLLSSVAEVFNTREKQELCNNGLLFVERMACAGYQEPARLIINALQPLGALEGAWILTTAVVLGLENACRMLIQQGISVNVPNDWGYHPLHVAIHQNRPELVKLLLESGLASPDDPTDVPIKDVVTPLMIAAGRGRADCVRMLLQNGADVNKCGKNGESPLHFSSWRGESKCLQLLLEQKGVELNEVNEFGCTPLCKAVENEQIKCIQMLLAAGADVRSYNRGVVHIAAFRNCTSILKVLLDAGAPLQGVFSKGTPSTPLHIASVVHALGCVRYMLSLGADVNATVDEGLTPLHFSVQASTYRYRHLQEFPHTRWKDIMNGEFKVLQPECVRSLITNGADVNARSKLSLTVLHACAEDGNPECLRILLDAGADISATCDMGRTALHYAAKGRSSEVLRILVEMGLPVNQRDCNGMTALHLAARYHIQDSIPKFLNCIEVLLNAGADILVCTCQGQTAWDLLARDADYMLHGNYSFPILTRIEKLMVRRCVELLKGNWD